MATVLLHSRQQILTRISRQSLHEAPVSSIWRRWQQQQRHQQQQQQQQTRWLSLAYTLHKPQGGEIDPERAPIIIMHGLFGSKQNNRSISKAIARDLKCKIYAIDLRNHGDSPHDPKHDYTVMAEDVEQFMDEHSIQKAVLIGHSMGAKVAMAVALRGKKPIESVIPVDNAPADATLKSDFAKYIQGMRKIEDSGCTKQTAADEILQGYEEALAIRQFLLTNLTRDPETKTLKFRVPIKTLGMALDNMGDFPFKNPDEARFDGPALFIRGTHSHYVADEVLPLIGRFFPCFEVKDIDSGHWVISEKPEEFRQAVVEFLKSKEEHV